LSFKKIVGVFSNLFKYFTCSYPRSELTVIDNSIGDLFWHPNGWTIYQVLEQYMRKVQQDNGYLEIKTPQIVDFTLWEKSGHAANYADNMFTTHSESRNYAVKPMNCPCHVQVFNQGLKSYRDLPIRLAEFGSCHRNEPSGSLHGIMRVRGLFS
jgi:threonyl-tRNA synthetase